MLKNVQTCTFSLLRFHSYSNISAYLGSLQGKKNRLRQMVTRQKAGQREIREGSVDLKVIQIRYFVLFNNSSKLGEFALKTLI